MNNRGTNRICEFRPPKSPEKVPDTFVCLQPLKNSVRFELLRNPTLGVSLNQEARIARSSWPLYWRYSGSTLSSNHRGECNLPIFV